MRWAPVAGAGLEHVRLRADAGGALVESVVAGTIDAASFGLFYRLSCDRRWRVHEAELCVAGEGKRLTLLSDGDGHWWDGDGHPLDALAGAIDIDIAATAFSSTLPIRRLQLARGEHRDLSVVCVTLPTLAVGAAARRYTCLEPGRLYRCAAPDSGVAADLAVDDDLLVLDYPGSFKRLA